MKGADVLAEHIRAMASAFSVKLVIQQELPPEAAASCRVVFSPDDGADLKFDVVVMHPVIDETTYAVALHEMGHALEPMGRLSNEKERVAE
jgi:hypothetical protein